MRNPDAAPAGAGEVLSKAVDKDERACRIGGEATSGKKWRRT